MEQKLKDLLHKKMVDLDATEAAPDFDKEKMWKALAGTMHSQRQRIRFVPGRWVQVAAALLIGLVLGGFAMRYIAPLSQNIFSAAPPAIGKKAPTDTPGKGAPAIPDWEAVAVKNGSSENHLVTREPVRSKDTENNAVAAKVPQPEVDLVPATAPAQNPLPVVVKAQTAASGPVPRALHLLDVESEDRTALLNGAVPMQTGISLSFYISPARLPEGKNANVPPSVLGPIIR